MHLHLGLILLFSSYSPIAIFIGFINNPASKGRLGAGGCVIQRNSLPKLPEKSGEAMQISSCLL
jgi:hypothetical protein